MYVNEQRDILHKLKGADVPMTGQEVAFITDDDVSETFIVEDVNTETVTMPGLEFDMVTAVIAPARLDRR